MGGNDIRRERDQRLVHVDLDSFHVRIPLVRPIVFLWEVGEPAKACRIVH
jgi:hypothetical protein